MRTQAEIVAQLEARYAQMEAELESPAMKWPCATCRWADKFEAAWCHQPLVRGLGEKVHMGMGATDRGKIIPRLCGPEKALWEPRRGLVTDEVPVIGLVAIGAAGVIAVLCVVAVI